MGTKFNASGLEAKIVAATDIVSDTFAGHIRAYVEKYHPDRLPKLRVNIERVAVDSILGEPGLSRQAIHRKVQRILPHLRKTCDRLKLSRASLGPQLVKDLNKRVYDCFH